VTKQRKRLLPKKEAPAKKEGGGDKAPAKKGKGK